MKRHSILLLFFCMLFFTPGIGQRTSTQSPSKKSPPKTSSQKKPQLNIPAINQQNKTMVPEIKWSGTITVVEKFTGLVGRSERYTSLVFNNALPTLHRNIETTDFNFTDDKGKGEVSEHTEFILKAKDEKTGAEKEIIRETCDCSGNRLSELHEVVIDHSDKTYRIHAVPPPCEGGSSGDGCGGASWDVIISEKPLGTNPFLLSGSETIERDITIGMVTTTTTWSLTGCPPWSDPQTRLQKNMHSIVKSKAERFIMRVHDELCIKLKVAQGFRTFEQQDELYTIGRPPPPAKTVTNAKGGESYHNYGLAIDVYIVKDNGQIDLNTRVPDKVVKIAKEEGFEWGGDWDKFKDYPHFEMTFGNKIKELKKIK